METQLDFDTYLHRINYSGSMDPTLDLAEALQRSQLYCIPFENFDILLGRGIDLTPSKILEKLVTQKRGGYCFELNGLLLMALEAFGFNARPLLARVQLSGIPSGRGHQIILITFQGRTFIVDAGFGNPNPRKPIPYELNQETVHDGNCFRLVDAGPFGVMLQTQDDTKWQNLYSFDLGHVCKGDIHYGNHYCSTHPHSFFTFSRIAALPSPEGVTTLLNTTLKKKRHKKETIQEIEGGHRYIELLKKEFNIHLDAEYKDLVVPPRTEMPNGEDLGF